MNHLLGYHDNVKLLLNALNFCTFLIRNSCMVALTYRYCYGKHCIDHGLDHVNHIQRAQIYHQMRLRKKRKPMSGDRAKVLYGRGNDG